MTRAGRKPLRKINNKIIRSIRPTRASTARLIIMQSRATRIRILQHSRLTRGIMDLSSPKKVETENSPRATPRSRPNRNGSRKRIPTSHLSARGLINRRVRLTRTIGRRGRKHKIIDIRLRWIRVNPKLAINQHIKEKFTRSLQKGRTSANIERLLIRPRTSRNPRKSSIKWAMCSRRSSKPTTPWNRMSTPTRRARP